MYKLPHVRGDNILFSDDTLLRVCDDVRDHKLAELGVRMEDREKGTVVKIVGQEAIMREREMERQVSGGHG